MCSRVLVSIVIAAAAVPAARAQTQYCRAALAARPRLDADSLEVISSIWRSYPVLATLEGAIVRATARSRIAQDSQGGQVIVAYAPELSIKADSIRADPALARAAAIVLTRLMSGSSPADVGTTAAELYSQWNLPLEPALRLLRANWADPQSRENAVAASLHRFDDPLYRDAARGALCSLAARASGVSQWLGLDDSASAYRALDESEMNLLLGLVGSLSEGQLAGNQMSLHEILPLKNPVSDWIRHYSPDLW